MQNRQNGRRRRGGGNNPRPMGQPMGGQGHNRLEVKVRGNANQLLEKYKTLARDAHQAGDRVATEYYLQHADHYFRVLNDTRIRHEELRARRNVFDPLDDDQVEDGAADADSGENDRRERGDERGRDEQRPEGDRPRIERRVREARPRPESRNPDRGNEEAAERADTAEVEASTRPGEEQEKPAPARTRTRRTAAPRETAAIKEDSGESVPPAILQPESNTLTMSDGEAALMAFGGPARRSTSRQAEVAVEVTGESTGETTVDSEPEAIEEAPKPRRRGRPRKTEVVVPVED